MRLLGFDITRAKALPTALLQPVDSRGGSSWWPIVRESFAGAWQQNVEINLDNVLTYFAVYACISRIASDIGKLRVKLMAQDTYGTWIEVQANSPFLPVLRKPNNYQTHNKFFEQWMSTKLIHGNAYVLKERDQRGVVTDLYVLDPCRVRPLIAPDGEVFYRLNFDYLAHVDQTQPTVPASEIIHDTINAFFHPLVGVSPIFACGLAAVQGLRIQTNSANLFGNGARPSGVLTAPGEISNDIAARLKNQWTENFTGANYGKVAVLGDGLKFEPMALTAEDSQLIEQLKFSAQTVCATFQVPPFMIGLEPPQHNTVQPMMLAYYAQCLQQHIESIETLLDEGLELPRALGTEFDLDGLLRMDTATLYDTIGKGIGASLLTPNEGRRKIDLPPLEGGDTAYLQQQNYSLAALARRDARDDPFVPVKQTVVSSSPGPLAPTAEENQKSMMGYSAVVLKELLAA